MAFFYPHEYQTVVQLRRDDGGGFSAVAGYMPPGLTGRLLVVSSANGRYYVEDREITLGENRAFVVDPAEVTRAEARDSLAAALSTLGPADLEALEAFARGQRPDLPGPTFRKRGC